MMQFIPEYRATLCVRLFVVVHSPCLSCFRRFDVKAQFYLFIYLFIIHLNLDYTGLICS